MGSRGKIVSFRIIEERIRGVVKAMKKLEPKSKQTERMIEPARGVELSGETVLITPASKSKDEAIADKMKMLQTRILGVSLGSYEIGEKREVLIPYAFLTFKYDIERRTVFNKNGALDKHGAISLVFDLNEFHPFHFDEEDGGRIELIKKDKGELRGTFLETTKSEEEMLKKAEWYIQNRLLRRVYSISGKLRLQENTLFYRRATEIKVYSKNVENIRYAYYDRYGTDNEHIFGLKYRLG